MNHGKRKFNAFRDFIDEHDIKIEDDPQQITHHLINEYFDGFNGKYYEPVKDLNELYPEDKAIRELLHLNLNVGNAKL